MVEIGAQVKQLESVIHRSKEVHTASVEETKQKQPLRRM
jgi:hypothetical protein